MKRKIPFYIIVAGLGLTFIVSTILLFSKEDISIAYLTTNSEHEKIPFLEYITSEEKAKLTENVGDFYFHQIDEKNTIFKKIKKIGSNQFVLLVEIKDQYYVYFINDNGEIKNKVFIDSGNVKLNDLVINNDNFTFVGQKNGKPYVLNTSKSGSMNWSNILNYQGIFNTIKSTSNGYLVAGQISVNNNVQAYLSLLNQKGDRIWENTFGRENEEKIVDVIVNSNNIIAVGTSNSNIEKQYNLLFLEYSKEGSLIFYDEYGNTVYNEYPTSVASDNQGNIYIGGYASSLNEKEWKSFFMKVSNSIKNNNLLDVEFFEILSIKPLSRIEELKVVDNTVVIAGVCVEQWPNYDVFLEVTNLNGIVLEQKIYGREDQELVYSFEISDEGEIIGVGQINSSENEIYPLLFKTDSNYRIPGLEKP